MQTLYLIRHTRPDISPGICYGQLDIDVTDSFEREAEEIRACLPPVDLIIASPLLRTRKLADFLAQTANWKPETGNRKLEPGNCKLERSGRNVSSGHRMAYPLRVETDVRLMEKHFGAWEGCAWNDIPRHEIDDWANDVMAYAPAGGESAQQLMLRAQEFLQELKKLPLQHIALVAHGGSIRALLALMADMPLTDTLNWQIEYGAVIGVQINRNG